MLAGRLALGREQLALELVQLFLEQVALGAQHAQFSGELFASPMGVGQRLLQGSLQAWACEPSLSRIRGNPSSKDVGQGLNSYSAFRPCHEGAPSPFTHLEILIWSTLHTP